MDLTGQNTRDKHNCTCTPQNYVHKYISFVTDEDLRGRNVLLVGTIAMC